MATPRTLLLVDDDVAHRTMLKANLAADGYRILEADDGDQVVPILEREGADLVLLDLQMARLGGLETLRAMKQAGAFVPVVILTAFSSVDSAVAAMKEGAYDYITKPVDIEELRLLLDRALNLERLQEENLLLRERLHESFNFGSIIGKSAPMRELFATLALVSRSDATVLIQGESGTGKELVANVIHENSPRRGRPFVAVNCAALHENLLESELFGHEKGAFTGATGQHKGRFEQADGGTLFLDEIGDMSLVTQAKILRVLQEGTFERVGGSRTIATDVRTISASHRDLEKLVAEGLFRQDLFFRLNVVTVALPPLRERREDIPLLARHFLQALAQRNRKAIQGFHPSAMAQLVNYDWPGNVRELENVVERAVVLCLGEQVTPADLPPQLAGRGEVAASVESLAAAGATLRDMEREMIRATLRETGGNRTRAAQILGIARQTLQNKMKEYDLS